MSRYTAEDIGARPSGVRLEEGKDFRFSGRPEPSVRPEARETMVEGVDYRFSEDKFRNLDDCIREAKPMSQSTRESDRRRDREGR